MIQSDQSNLERENTTGRNVDGIRANTPVRVLTASSIIGDDVINKEGDKLASIKDIMLNVHDGTIEYVVLSAGGFLGIGDKLFAVPYRELQLMPEKKCFSLNRDKTYIKSAPGFDQDHWPETNAQYDEVNVYWGTDPYYPGSAATKDYNSSRTGSSGITDPSDQGTFVKRNKFD